MNNAINNTTVIVEVSSLQAMAELTKLINSVTGASMNINGNLVTITDPSGVIIAGLSAGSKLNITATAIKGISWAGNKTLDVVRGVLAVGSSAACVGVQLAERTAREVVSATKDPVLTATKTFIGASADFAIGLRGASVNIVESDEMAKAVVVKDQAVADAKAAFGWMVSRFSSKDSINGVRIVK